MPGNNYIVFKNLRPPVCIDSADGSPLKTKNVKDLISEQFKPEFDKYLKRIKANGYEKGWYGWYAQNA